MSAPDVAVILPCYNEGKAIRAVVKAFRRALPDAHVYVFDNASEDNTAEEARAAGAIVKTVRARGKGNVLRYAFAVVEADVYVLADGDGTYDASRARELVHLLWSETLDMVVGTRDHGSEERAYRSGHVAGNRAFNTMVRWLFGRAFVDIFSGYRIFSRPFVKSFPALAAGFETETEMSLHAIQLGLPCVEVPTAYSSRIEGTESKLRTLRDGGRILWFIIRLLKHTRPLALFSTITIACVGLSLLLGLPILIEFLETGLVPRLPTAVAAASLMVIATLALATGLILDTLAYVQLETKRLAYLATDRRTSRMMTSAFQGGIISQKDHVEGE